MKLENVIKGKRVVLKTEVSVSSDYPLQAGTLGTILQGGNTQPYIQWDGFTAGHSYGNPTAPNSSWAVHISKLRKA